MRAAGENSVFPGSPAEWTADQKRLIAISKEYSNFFEMLAIRKHEPPKDEILSDYRKFREWWSAYREDPDIGDNPYKKYNHGFSVK